MAKIFTSNVDLINNVNSTLLTINSMLKRIGGEDREEWLKMAIEDQEYCQRLKDMNWKFMWMRNLMGKTKNTIISEEDAKNALHYGQEVMCDLHGMQKEGIFPHYKNGFFTFNKNSDTIRF